jgi:hypothetical protein
MRLRRCWRVPSSRPRFQSMFCVPSLRVLCSFAHAYFLCAFPVLPAKVNGKSDSLHKPILRPHVHSITFPFTHDSVIDALALYDFEVDLHLRSLASTSARHIRERCSDRNIGKSYAYAYITARNTIPHHVSATPYHY